MIANSTSKIVVTNLDLVNSNNQVVNSNMPYYAEDLSELIFVCVFNGKQSTIQKQMFSVETVTLVFDFSYQFF